MMGNQLDGGSPWDRMDHGLGAEVVANVVIFTVPNERLTVKVLDAHAVGTFRMTGCSVRKESAITMSTKQNLECLVREKPDGIQDGGGFQVVHRTGKDH